MLFFWRIFSIGITLSVIKGQGSTCPISKGTPSVVNRVLGKIDAVEKCAEACKTRTNCIWWQFKKRTNECSIAKLKIIDDRKIKFALKNCDSPPTTISGLESLLAEVRNISRVVEDLKEQNENGFNSLNEKLTNVESQNQNGLNSLNEKLTNVESQNEVLQSDFMEQTNLTLNGFNSLNEKLTNVESQNQVLQSDFMEQTNLTMNGFNSLNEKLTNVESQNQNGLNSLKEKLTNVESQNESGFNSLNEKLANVESQNQNGLNSLNEKLTNVEGQNEDVKVELENLEEQTNLIKTEINENIDAKFAVVYTDHEILKNEAQMNYNKSMEKLEENQKLSEVSIGMTLEEYEAKEMYCSTNGDFFDINTGYCYKYKVLNDTERIWDEARTQCVEEGGDFASIKSRQEWEVVKDHIIKSGVSTLWLGGSDADEEGTWVWTDGSPVMFSNWGHGRPYSSNTNANCIRAWGNHDWIWSDFGCSYIAYALCKIRA